MSIEYFNDLQFISGSEVPDCRVQINQDFGDTVSINYLWRGKIHFAAGNAQSTHLVAPMFYWTLPDVHYRYGNLGDHPWHQMWVMVKGPRIQQMLKKGLIPPSGINWSRPVRAEAWYPLMRDLLDCVHRGQARDLPWMVHTVERFFLDAHAGLSLLQAPASNDSSAKIKALTAAIASSPQQDWNWSAQAEAAGLSYAHFRRLFAELNGTSPHQYLLLCRLRYAARLLRSGNYSVKAAAFESGFKTPDALTMHLKQKFGITATSLSTYQSEL